MLHSSRQDIHTIKREMHFNFDTVIDRDVYNLGMPKFCLLLIVSDNLVQYATAI